ncbi:hypothetical protein PpBr36_06838 [Pyricularia pennisetigena]|uniref:hypothetical protein n=1 Tax=Pyricularia pennisetigena TaxID=1578925 RepID=UPI001154C405|nr:hypothetical protein PpBr36_06838 [Pyricularia pennisetigena]TLS25419.1 hypothetical protein PpBr36_06838 [Pyricularia pennisetigena]
MCGEKKAGAPTGTPCWLSIPFAASLGCRLQIGAGRPHLTRIGIEQCGCGEGKTGEPRKTREHLSLMVSWERGGLVTSTISTEFRETAPASISSKLVDNVSV